MRHRDNEPPLLDVREVDLPRWLEVPVGIVVAIFTVFCAFATVDMVLLPGKKSEGPSPVFAAIIVLVLLLVCLWVLGKCVRLVTGRKKKGGLMGPTALRVVAIFLLIMPVAGLFTGYYRENGARAVFQAVMYVFGFFGLRAMARKREAALEEQTKCADSETQSE